MRLKYIFLEKFTNHNSKQLFLQGIKHVFVFCCINILFFIVALQLFGTSSFNLLVKGAS